MFHLYKVKNSKNWFVAAEIKIVVILVGVGVAVNKGERQETSMYREYFTS